MLPIRRTAAAIGAVALAGALFAAAPAQADTATPAPAAPKTAKSAPKGDGAKGICKRLPKTETRISTAITRLNGDVTVLGSVARLEQRVANAQTAGHTEVHTYLNDRLTFRKSLLPTLQKRQDDLKAVSTWCSAQGSK
ncbi:MULTISPECIES: hypothetical protein [unclassified Streptomyces]|uniref:hypothetical protein n=1 Tax=unclassified Streptomyces TaxID=2593676 RepID=UPI002E147AC8|nr:MULTISPECIES: hypothetical protein [unclassified Streptomyces]WSR24343.1 hypothetical protein OG573_38215 [Streptomyces sp. NBC_01205]